MWDEDREWEAQQEAAEEEYYARLREQFMPDLYEEFAREVLSGKDELYTEIIDQFTAQRLQSYYLDNPTIAERARLALVDARALRAEHPSASLVFATISIEVGLKTTLLKPILHGLVSIDSASALVAGLIPAQHNDNFKKVLLGVLKEVGGVDLLEFKRKHCNQTLWDEIVNIRKRRNEIIHRGERAPIVEADHAIDVGSTVVEYLFPRVIAALGLKTNDLLQIVNK